MFVTEDLEQHIGRVRAYRDVFAIIFSDDVFDLYPLPTPNQPEESVVNIHQKERLAHISALMSLTAFAIDHANKDWGTEKALHHMSASELDDLSARARQLHRHMDRLIQVIEFETRKRHPSSYYNTATKGTKL